MKRREFLSTSLKLSGALLIHFNLPLFSTLSEARQKGHFYPNGWLEITPENQFIFTLDKAEIGQNVITSLTAILAEEMDIDYSKLEVRFPTIADISENPFYQPTWGTGGSSSVRSLWNPLRNAGAATKALFIAAAAKHWNISANYLSSQNGTVFSQKTNQEATFAELIPLADQIPRPSYKLKSFSDFTQLGGKLKRQDLHQKVSGKTKYGIDCSIPNQKCAILVRSPKINGKPTSFDATEALKMPEVTDIFMISNGIAVIADSYWSAKQAGSLVNVRWNYDENISTKALYKQLKQKLNNAGETARDKGNAVIKLEESDRVYSARYSVPLLAHAPLEPMNCTAWFHDNLCEIWVPTQRPLLAKSIAQKTSGFSAKQIIVHTCFIGGGFGRRLKQDYVAEVVEIAQKVAYPVKLIWSREDDMQHGFFRPMVVSEFKAAISADNDLIAWYNYIASLVADKPKRPQQHKSIKQRFKTFLIQTRNKIEGRPLINNAIVEGATSPPYSIDNIKIDFSSLKSDVRVGPWRSIGNSYNAFFVESFINELAATTKQDPVDFRLKLFQPEDSRLANTLKRVADLANWCRPLSKGRYRGVACHSCFGSYVSQIVEISLHKGKPKVEHVFCAVDCGFVIDPIGTEAQIQGAIIFALTAALYGCIDIEKGEVIQSNFHNYPILRINETPKIQIEMIESTRNPSGVGEIGVPPIAAALTNAWFQATGSNVRDLPLIKPDT